MKFVAISLLVLIFVATPLYVLNSMVLPEFTSLQQTYAHADTIANQAAGIAPAAQ